jgi:hypothetical protein
LKNATFAQPEPSTQASKADNADGWTSWAISAVKSGIASKTVDDESRKEANLSIRQHNVSSNVNPNPGVSKVPQKPADIPVDKSKVSSKPFVLASKPKAIPPIDELMNTHQKIPNLTKKSIFIIDVVPEGWGNDWDDSWDKNVESVEHEKNDWGTWNEPEKSAQQNDDDKWNSDW